MKTVALSLLVAAALSGAPAWKPLFDGKTLKGWKQCNGTAKYVVEQGAIVGTTAEGSPNSFLCTDRTYGDFVLEFEVKVDPRLNSGVQVRSHQYPADATVRTFDGQKVVERKQPAGRVYGYQVEISNEQSGAAGGIYDEARRGWVANIQGDPVASKAFRDNQWNKYKVEAMGDRIRVTLNGVPAADLVDSMDLEGFIALQVHSFKGDSPAQVRWRNIRIQDLGKHAWKPVGDGKTLNGWVKLGGGEWALENGAYAGRTAAAEQKRGLLVWNQEWKDFTVRLQYKTVKGNSGVFFRMGDPENGTDVNKLGYEIEVDPTRDAGGLQEPGRGARGWIHHTGPAAQLQYFRPNEFNELVISAHGGDVTIHVNGVQTSAVRNDPGRRSGRLAFQLNPRQEIEVHYKDIAILTAAE